jgi:hypothetical protein
LSILLDMIERFGVHCSGFIHAQLPLGLLGFLRGIDNLCIFLMVLKMYIELMLEVCYNGSSDPTMTS